VAVHGTSAWVRQLVRWTRAAANLTLIRQWLNDLASGLGQPTLRPPRPADTDPDAPGFGRANATRGTPSGTCSSTSSGSGSTDSTHAGEDLANDSTLPQRARIARCLKWVAPLIRRGLVSEACEVDGAGGVEGFLGCADRRPGEQDGVFVACPGGGVDRESEGMG